MKRLLVILATVLLFLAGNASAQSSTKPIKAGSKIWIEEMVEDLDGYIRAEMVKQKVPLEIVINREDADYMMKGSATEEEVRKWHEGLLPMGKDKTSGNVFIIERDGDKMIWAAEAGDRSWFWGGLKRGGHRKVAERLVSNLKKACGK